MYRLAACRYSNLFWYSFGHVCVQCKTKSNVPSYNHLPGIQQVQFSLITWCMHICNYKLHIYIYRHLNICILSKHLFMIIYAHVYIYISYMCMYKIAIEIWCRLTWSAAAGRIHGSGGSWAVTYRETFSQRCDRPIWGWKKMVDFNQWPFQEPKLEVPTIYKAYFLGNIHEYPNKIWPEKWYSTSILGSWNSHWFNQLDSGHEKEMWLSCMENADHWFSTKQDVNYDDWRWRWIHAHTYVRMYVCTYVRRYVGM